MRQTQIAKFVDAINLMAVELDRAHRRKCMPTVAWAARSLLELSIWTEYCCASESNAQRFSDDAARDMIGILKMLQRDMREQTGSDDPKISEMMGTFSNFGKAHGIARLGDDFKRVADAARELGKKHHFLSHNKIFSKMAHPTAWAVSSAGLKSEADARDLFFGEGVGFALASAAHIRDLIITTFPRPKLETEVPPIQ